jgi:hypothetical protein
MSDDDLEELRQLKFMPSRIPALDALEVFVPKGAESDPELDQVRAETGQSRWYPVDGGHRVLILYEGAQFNADRFTLLPGGWDHEHCSRCHGTIEPMTLCWVTESGPYVLLDEKCYRQLADPELNSPGHG